MMEWVEATKFALKSSIRSELTNSMMKSSCYSNLPPQLNVDDFLCIAGVNGVLPSEDFSVDEFFDLPACENDDGRNSKDGYSDVLGEENEEDNVSGDQIDDDGTLANSSCEPLSAAELAVPADDMKELELWSHLMDDSVTESYSSYPNVSFPMETGFHQPEGHTQPEPFHSKLSLIPPGFPAKPRSKRPRTITGRTWSYGSAPKSESDSSSNSSSSPKSVLLLNNPFVQGIKLYGRPPTVKKPKKRATETSGSQLVVVQQRRCSHCLVTKTPQWRAGPTGPKTLCNACGVRFKSGRLFPEYRPACSPTFSSEMHSNSHRKVLEMRKKKEMVEPESESSSPIVDASCVLKKSGGPDEVAD